MSKGTPSLGKKGRKHTHVRCPRCGAASLHARKRVCAKCGFGRSRKRND